MTNQPSAPVVLSASESWSLLREAVVGRLAVVIDDLPEIFPVNYLVASASMALHVYAALIDDDLGALAARLEAETSAHTKQARMRTARSPVAENSTV